VDWVGAHYDRSFRDTPPIQKSRQIRVILQQLCETRAQEDHRRLAQYSEPEVAEPAMAAPGGDDEDASSQTAHTQLAFGTQISHPIPSRSKGREPVLARNLQRERIIAGAANTQNETKHKLLSLLEKPSKSIPSEPKARTSEDCIPNTVRKQPTVSGSATSPKPSSISLQSSPPREETENEDIHSVSPAPVHRKKRRRKETSPAMAKTQHAAEIDLSAQNNSESHLPEKVATHLNRCSWMQGVVFNRETLKVPMLQQECLSKDTSWLKPQPGLPPFQNGNMPQSILQAINRIADEKAAIEDAVDTDNQSDVDPSPDSLPHPTQDDEDTTSQVSWSPSPEPPQMPTRALQGLPPDSSIEKQTSSAEHASGSQARLSTQQSERLDSDEEMEDFVPQALGEDLVEVRRPDSADSSRLSSIPDRARSVVQVRETPDAKGKFFKGAISQPCPRKGSESSSQDPHTSSTSVIQSTYDMPKASNTAETERHHVPVVEDPVPVLHDENSNAKQAEAEANDSMAVNTEHVPTVSEHLTKAMQVQEADSKSAAPLMPKTSVGKAASTVTPSIPSNSTQPASKISNSETSPSIPGPVSAAVKRKLADSPSKNSRRHSKRREIKIVGFGDGAPVSGDPVAALRKDREESLRRFQEERRSSTSVDSRPGSAAKLVKGEDADDMDLDVGDVDAFDQRVPPHTMSPRHQSLYDEPSPRRASTTRPISPSVSITVKDMLPPQSSHQPLDRATEKTPTRKPPANFDQNGHMTIFQSFKEAYPDYTGGANHFKAQCAQMYKLDQEDKMVPKWQWDDFIIRNRTDYKQYAIECIDQGDSPEPYHRFYKDSIRDTLYTKGIIGSTKMLQRALEEMSGQPTLSQPARGRPPEKPHLMPPTTHSNQSTEEAKKLPTLLKSDPSRKSLPNTFNQPKLPRQDRIDKPHSRTRYSLPAQQPQSRSRVHLSSSSLSASSLPQPLTTEETPLTTGDPYRDYFFAIQRSTSWTGSTKVSSKSSSSTTTNNHNNNNNNSNNS